MSNEPMMRDILIDGVDPDSPMIAITVPDCEHSSLVLNTGSSPFESWNVTCIARGTEAQESWI